LQAVDDLAERAEFDFNPLEHPGVLCHFGREVLVLEPRHIAKFAGLAAIGPAPLTSPAIIIYGNVRSRRHMDEPEYGKSQGRTTVRSAQT
jgi:hypothetical protein